MHSPAPARRGLLAAALAVFAVLGLTAGSADAAYVTKSVSDSFGRSAKVEFTQTGTSITVKLTNMSATAATIPTHILTALFFDVKAGTPSFTMNKVSALIPTGTGSYHHAGGDEPTGGNVGGEWGAKSMVGATRMKYGISSTGLGLFSPGDRFDTGSNLQGPTSLNGVEWGIANATYDGTGANGGLEGESQIKGSATFSFTSADFDINNISAVGFQYGTALDEPYIVGFLGEAVPAPPAVVLAVMGVGLFGFVGRRLRRPAVA